VNFNFCGDIADYEISEEGPRFSETTRTNPMKIRLSAPLQFNFFEKIFPHVAEERNGKSGRHINNFQWLPRIDYHFCAVSDEESITADVVVKKNGLILLNSFVPSVQWKSGSSDVDLHVRGSIHDPKISGSVTVSKGVMNVDALEDTIRDISGKIMITEKEMIRVRNFRCSLGGRSVSLAGSLPVRDPAAVVKHPLTLRVGRVLLRLKDKMYGRLNGHVSVEGTAFNPVLTGSMKLYDAMIFASGASGKGLAQQPDGEETQPLAPKSGLQEFLHLQKEVDESGSHLAISSNGAHTDDAAAAEVASNEDDSGPDPGSEEQDDTEENADESAREVPYPGVMLSKSTKIAFNNLQVSLGKDVRIMYPYIFSTMASGSVTFDGTLEAPQPEGVITFKDGEVNLMATKMNMSPDSRNTATFRRDLGLDPLVNVTLEDSDLTVQMREVRASQWSDRLELTPRRIVSSSGDSWVEVMESRLSDIGGTLGRQVGPDIAIRALANAYSLSGYIGPARWKIYPQLFSGRQNAASGPPEAWLRTVGPTPADASAGSGPGATPGPEAAGGGEGGVVDGGGAEECWVWDVGGDGEDVGDAEAEFGGVRERRVGGVSPP